MRSICRQSDFWRLCTYLSAGSILFLFASLQTFSQEFEGFTFEDLEVPYCGPRMTVGVEPHPFAGKYEPRVGASWLSEVDGLRLDIGTRVSLHSDTVKHRSTFDAGAEFFTWTRLRSEGGFKFPVESVDYDFGLYATARMMAFGGDGIVDSRLRIAHISAHRVDGDKEILRDPSVADVYSREFVDISFGASSNSYPLPVGRFYVGGLWLFHVIPDSLAGITPYIGFDATIDFTVDDPSDGRGWPGIRLGGELRLNTEVGTTLETMLKLGLWIGGDESKGLMIEGGWYHGHSPFGPYYPEVASTAFVGFSLLR